MKRFSRSKPGTEGASRKLKTEIDEVLDLSQDNTSESIIPNNNNNVEDNNHRNSRMGSQVNQKQYKNAIAYLHVCLKNKRNRILAEVWKKILSKNKNSYEKRSKFVKIFKIREKYDFFLKTESMFKIKIFSMKRNLKFKSLALFNSVINIHQRRVKKQTILKLLEYTRNQTIQQNKMLHQIQAKYLENSIGDQYAKQLRKFIRINPRNMKNFIKTSQEIVEPALNAIIQQLQSKRIKKNVQSDSEVLVGITKNYMEVLKETNAKISGFQTEMKALSAQKQQAVKELKQYSKQVENKVKDIKKMDNQIIQKSQALAQSNYSAQGLKTLQRFIDNQLKICEGKTYNGYEYSSRLTTLKVTSALMKRLLESLDIPADKSPVQNRITPKPIFTPKKKNSTEIIQEQTSLQESDVVDEIKKIVQRLIIELNKNNDFENIKACESENSFHSQKKNMQTPELKSIYAQFEQILSIFYQTKFNSLHLQKQNKELKSRLNQENKKLSLELQNKNFELNFLNQKIVHFETQIRKSQLQKLEQIDQIEKQVNKKQKQLIQTIEALSIKLEQSFNETEVKTKQIQQLQKKHDQKQKKLNLAKEEYKKFKKMMQGSLQKNKEREKSIDSILQKSLSKSKVSINSTMMNRTFDISNSKAKDSTKKDGRKKSANKSHLNSPISAVESIVDEFSIDYSDHTETPQKNIVSQLMKRTSSNKNLKIGHSKIEEGSKKTKNKKKSQDFSDLTEVIDQTNGNQAQRLQSKIYQLTEKLYEADRKIKQIKNTSNNPNSNQYQNECSQFLPLSLLPQNIIRMLHNILTKLKQVPTKSKYAQQIWSELMDICEECNGIELLSSLQEYVVKWINRNLDQIYSKKIKTIFQRQDESANPTPKKSPRGSPSTINFTNPKVKQFNRTLKQIVK